MSEALPNKPFVYTWSNELQCGWNAWHAVDDGVLHLHLQPGHCCDMDGAIRVAQSMMPLVWRIVTFSGKTQDVEYKNVRGKWIAYQPTKFPSKRKESP